jgi:predicted O-methyltransferase YrrM
MAEVYIALDKRLHDYLLANEPPEHAELSELRRRTGTMPDARMQIAPEQGHFLAFLARLIGASRTLELGTFTGYSALAVALALPAKGQVVTCDVNEKWTKIGRPYWERAGVAHKIEVRIAPALKTLAQLANEMIDHFDLALIDADKEEYDAYYESALRLVRPGGLIVLDNTLRLGRVADPSETDTDSVSMRKLNAKIAGDERVDRVLLPIGDGMTLVRRR